MVYKSEHDLRDDLHQLTAGRLVKLETEPFVVPLGKGGFGFIKKVGRSYAFLDQNMRKRKLWRSIDKAVDGGMRFTWNGHI